MQEHEFEQELSALFAREDKALDGKAFEGAVMSHIRRRLFFRRVMLTAAGAAGAMIAGAQLPELLSSWGGMDWSMPGLAKPDEMDFSAFGLSAVQMMMIAAAMVLGTFGIIATERA